MPADSQPFATHIEPGRFEGAWSEYHLDPGHYDRRRPNRVYQEALAARGIPTLDFTPLFADAAARGERWSFPLDHHWNATGHARAAEALLTFLDRERLLPARSPAAGSSP